MGEEAVSFIDRISGKTASSLPVFAKVHSSLLTSASPTDDAYTAERSKVHDLHQACAQSGEPPRPRASSHPGSPTSADPGDDAYCRLGRTIEAQLVRPRDVMHVVRHPHWESIPTAEGTMSGTLLSGD